MTNSLLSLSSSLSSRSNRRIAVSILWSVFLSYVALTVTGDRSQPFAAMLMLVGLVVMTLLNRSVGLHHDSGLDERQVAEQNRNHVTAFNAVAYAMFVPLVYGFAALKTGWWLPSSREEIVGAFTAVAIGIGLVPLSILAWRKRDEETDPDEARSRASRRLAIASPGREIIGALFAASLGLLAIRLAGSSFLGTLSGSELAGLVAAFGLSLIVTRTENRH